MAKETINIGTTPNDRKGDSLRAAFQKVNANFTELYNTTDYSPATPEDWDGTAPSTISSALDRLAAAVKALNNNGA